MMSFIISSSFYLNKILLEKNSLEERILLQKISLRLIALALIKVTKKKRNSSRTIQIYLSRRKQLNYNKRTFFRFISFSFVKLTAEKHAREKQYLFDTAL